MVDAIYCLNYDPKHRVLMFGKVKGVQFDITLAGYRWDAVNRRSFVNESASITKILTPEEMASLDTDGWVMITREHFERRVEEAKKAQTSV